MITVAYSNKLSYFQKLCAKIHTTVAFDTKKILEKVMRYMTSTKPQNVTKMKTAAYFSGNT